MKGEVFNLLEAFIVDNWGEDVYESIFQAAHAKLITREPFVGPGTYPDHDFLQLLGAAVERLGVPVSEAAFAFGKYCFPKLAEKMPHYVDIHSHPKDFLKTLESVIHTEVRKVMKGAHPPYISWQDPGPQRLRITYRSPRKLYDFAQGLLEGVGEYYNVPMTVARTMENFGEAQVCHFDLEFGGSSGLLQ